MARPFAAFMVAGTAYSRVDTVLVGFLAPVGAVAAAGAYFSAMRVVAGLEYIADSLARASFPRLAVTYRDRPSELLLEVMATARALTLISAPIPAVVWAVGPDLMVAVFGAGVAPYAWLIIPLAAILPMRFLSYLFGMTLTSSDAQGRRALAAVAAIGVVMVVDFALIPTYGVTGAVVGSVLASLVVLAVYTRSIAGMLDSPVPLRLVAEAAAISLVLVALVVALAHPLGRPAAAMAVLFAYAAASGLLARRPGFTRTSRGSA
jgi:O-antigen/teichoic acid export membrane protein